MDVVQTLLDAGIHLDIRDQHANTALHTAADFGRMDIVEVLVNRGADISAKNKWGSNPLAVAKNRKAYLDSRMAKKGAAPVPGKCDEIIEFLEKREAASVIGGKKSDIK